MATPDESRIDYVDGPISGARDGWTDSVPSALGYDWDAEQLLSSSVLDIKQVSARCAAEQFGLDDEEFRQGLDCLIRVDYQSWAAPNEFDPEAPEHVVYRREHVYVRRSVLLAEEVFSYGLGREFDIELWESDEEKEGSPEEVRLPPGAREFLQSEIEREQREGIAEWLDGDVDNIPAGLGEAMQALYEEIAQETRQAQDAAEQEAQAKAKRGQRAKKPIPSTRPK